MPMPKQITVKPSFVYLRNPKSGEVLMYQDSQIVWQGKDADDLLKTMTDWHKEQHKKDMQGVSGIVTERV